VATIVTIRDLRRLLDDADDIQRNIDRLESSCAIERQPYSYRQYIEKLRKEKANSQSQLIAADFDVVTAGGNEL
jgi:hypothetical protein